MKKAIYLASYKAKQNYNNITYQDKYIERDLGGDMLEIDLTNYEIVIATPPCNYYSKANWRRETSKYSQATKHLLPEILKKLVNSNKIWIVENVRNKTLMKEFINIAPSYTIGRHTYWTNLKNFRPEEIKQVEEERIQYTGTNRRQGGENVKLVMDYFLQKCNEM